jgi:hypothetical protein
MKSALALCLATLFIGACASTPPSVLPVTELDYPSNLKVIRRADWGWKALPDTIPQHTISRITIHHSGVFFPEDRDPVDYIRHLQDWSRSERSWIDIPYHFMIDLEGKVYEARPLNYPGDTNTDYDPRGHALICVIGNFEEQSVTQAQWTSLVHLTSYLARTFHVPIDSVRSHKDYTETLCPGKDLYQYLKSGELQKQVLRELNQSW